jgi:hypothetical protein
MTGGAERTTIPGPGPGVPIPVPEPPGPDLIPEPGSNPQPPDVSPSPDPQYRQTLNRWSPSPRTRRNYLTTALGVGDFMRTWLLREGSAEIVVVERSAGRPAVERPTPPRLV